jgi:hypothetical protein
MGNLYVPLCVHTPMIESDRKYTPLKANNFLSQSAPLQDVFDPSYPF